MDYSSYTTMQLVYWIPWIILSAFPTYKLFGRTGQSRWWTLFVIIPIFGIIAVLMIAGLGNWPKAAVDKRVS